MTTRLKLFQLVSPALPVGAFSYSEGLETLVQAGVLTGPAALEAWLRAELQRGAVCAEAAALAPLGQALGKALGHCRAGSSQASNTAAAELLDLDGWLLAQREAPELRAQQLQMGGSLLQLLQELGWPLPDTLADALAAPLADSLAWPAAFAWAAQCLELGSPEREEAYLYGWVANQLSAAVRLVPLGPTQAQRLQLQLAPLIADRARQLAITDPRSLWSGGVGAGLAQLQHGELYSRLFRS